MYFDLFLPFPLPTNLASGTPGPSKKAKKNSAAQSRSDQQGTSSGSAEVGGRDCWSGLATSQKEGFAKSLALSGHLGYSVIGCTVVAPDPSTQPLPCSFTAGVPYPDLDSRFRKGEARFPSGTGGTRGSKAGRGDLVQVTRFHSRVDDSKTHCFQSNNTNVLKQYDLLSVTPNSEKALQLACTDLANPGPNQISIITLPMHEKPFTFRYNRKQIKQALRNGVVFEILYSAALFPPPSYSSETARRFRQNFMSNARELVRITGGKGVILSSGPGGSAESLRGALDVVNLGTLLGMPANLAKEAVESGPRGVLLRAQARKTFKGVFGVPRLVPALSVEARIPTADEGVEGRSHDEMDHSSDHEMLDTTKRTAEGIAERIQEVKKPRLAV